MIKLSKREEQVVYLCLANLSSQQIADIVIAIDGKKSQKTALLEFFVISYL